MEIVLTRKTDTQVSVTCNNHPSHIFDLQLLDSLQEGFLIPPDDPVTYGKVLFQALFPVGTMAREALDKKPERLLLVASSDDLDAIPWEYTYGPDDFLVSTCKFVRGLPKEQRLPYSTPNVKLHIVAIPSHPLSKSLQPLNIEGEWLCLKEIIEDVSFSCTLERAHPPTVEQMRRLIANQRHRVVHFMGHGGQFDTGAVLCFEKENGALDPVTAQQFVMRVRGTVFLVTLNACVSASPGHTNFSNLAASLAHQKVPYALGMRFSIHDEDARTFSRNFYTDLANGTSVEEALLQARLALANSPRCWVIGVPVLYTALAEPAPGFCSAIGTPEIKEPQPYIDVSVLPRAEGIFQGRIEELKMLGDALTGDNRARIITIHGGGGQGKTALTREAVERFAHAWRGGIWATSLENLPSKATLVADLAHYLDIQLQDIQGSEELERRVLEQLARRRMLIMLDNAETLVEATENHEEKVYPLIQFFQQLPSATISLLITSRTLLGWSGEQSCELGGLSPDEGAILFRQSAPQHAHEIDMTLAERLSEELEGHPLGLFLLGKAFNEINVPLHSFVKTCEKQLIEAENKYLREEHRHRKLYACIETSVRSLDKDLRSLLSGLWIFHSPFLAETAVTIFDPEHTDNENSPSLVH